MAIKNSQKIEFKDRWQQHIPAADAFPGHFAKRRSARNLILLYCEAKNIFDYHNYFSSSPYRYLKKIT